MLRRGLSTIRNFIWPTANEDQPATSPSSAQEYQQASDQPQQSTVSEATPLSSTQECHHTGQPVPSTITQERVAEQPATASPITQAPQQLPKQPQRRTYPEATPLTGTQEDRHTGQSVLNDITLNHLAERMGTDWARVGYSLGFRKDQIDRIKEDCPRTLERAFEMLYNWKCQQDLDNDGGVNKALEALCKALEENGRKDVVGFLRGCADGVDDLPLEACRAEFIRYYKEELSVVRLLPWFPLEVSKINDVHVNVNLDKKEKTGRVKQRDIDSYEDMLRLEFNDGQPVRFILLSGIAGSGKTTIVSKIANDWAQETPESPLSKFRLLIALSMRELKRIPDLSEAIFDQILPKDTKVTRESLKRYLKSHSDEVLVILDGADEFDEEGSQLPAEGDFTDIISNKILRGCTVIVTTRPHMVHKLCSLNPCFTRIESIGFSDTEIQEYIRKFFKGKRQEVSDGLFWHLRTSGNLRNLASAPMMLLLICLVWSDEHKLPETLTELFKETFSFFFKRHFLKYGQTCSDTMLERELTDLVQTLGKTALNGLMIPDQRLVFQTSQFGNCKMVEKACSLGILSQEKVRSKLHAVEHVTFFHKTFQEAIAGFYWADLAESDTDSFNSYLSHVNEENFRRSEYLMRFCCGRNVEAARYILNHITDIFSGKHQEKMEFGMLPSSIIPVAEDQRREFCSISVMQRLWISLHLEAGSKELHNIAIPVFRDIILFGMSRDEFIPGLAFLINCAASSRQSFLTEVMRVYISRCSIRNVSVISKLLRHSTIVTDVDVHFKNVDDGDTGNERWQVELADAISGIKSLLNFKLGFSPSKFLHLSEMFSHFAQSNLSSCLQCFSLTGVYVNSSSLARFITKQSKLCKIVLSEISEYRAKSSFDATDFGGLDSESLKQLELRNCKVIASNLLHLWRSCPNLEVLVLSGNGLCEREIKRINVLLSTTPKLKELALSGNAVGNTFPCLVEQLFKLESLEVLKLGSTSVDDWLRGFWSHGETLNLDRSRDGSTHKLEVSDLLKLVQWSCNSTSLKELHIRGDLWHNPDADETESTSNESANACTTQSIHQTHHSSIETLIVSHNRFGQHTASFIGLLKQMPSLKKLSLRSMGLTNSDAVLLAEILQYCDHIQGINLLGNKVECSGLEALLRVLPKLTDLELIGLPGVRDGPTEMVRECFECIEKVRFGHSKSVRGRSNIQSLVEVVQRY